MNIEEKIKEILLRAPWCDDPEQIKDLLKIFEEDAKEKSIKAFWAGYKWGRGESFVPLKKFLKDSFPNS